LRPGIRPELFTQAPDVDTARTTLTPLPDPGRVWSRRGAEYRALHRGRYLAGWRATIGDVYEGDFLFRHGEGYVTVLP